jgi:type IV secretory pathway VirB10-like protein
VRHLSLKFVIISATLTAITYAPNMVLAQDDPTERIQLSPETPERAAIPAPASAAMPAPESASTPTPEPAPLPAAESTPMSEVRSPNTMSPRQEYYPLRETPSRPFQYPNYGYQNQQQGYGEPYTRPGYYPSGSPDYEAPSNYPQYQPQYQSQQQPAPDFRGGLAYIPQGLVIPIDLRTAISTQVAKEGDFIEASVNTNVPLNGTSYLPAGTVISGQITEAKAGRRLSRSGSLSIEFNNLRLPSGASFPIRAHLLGSIGRYKDVNGVERGEGMRAKLGQFAIRGIGGAGLGAALGTGLGAIVGGGSGAGTGAWAGAAFGGGLGAMDMLLRKGRDVIIPSGTVMRLQMEQPLSLPLAGSPATY